MFEQIDRAKLQGDKMTEHQWKQWPYNYCGGGEKIISMEECEVCGVSRESSLPLRKGSGVVGPYDIWQRELTCEEVFIKRKEATKKSEQLRLDRRNKNLAYINKYSLVDNEYYWVLRPNKTELYIRQLTAHFHSEFYWFIRGKRYDLEEIIPIQHIEQPTFPINQSTRC